MSYKSLYKLFMMHSSDDFNKIYLEKFNSNSTIKFDIYINNNQSFFNYDKDIMSIASKIRFLDKHICEIFSDLPILAINQYIRKSLIDEIESTNKIEGVISTRKDINDLINEIESKIKIKNRFFGIVNKYILLTTKEKMEFKTAFDIRKLYDEMLYNEIKEEDEKKLPDGKIFRNEAVHVYKSGEKIVHHGVMPEEKIIDYMDKALDILNDESIDVLIRVSLFHYYIGYIHPFYDGNGRMARFISSYILSKNFNNIIGYRLSMTIKENLSKYLDAFSYTNDIRNKGDISTFVYEFLDIIYKAFEKTEIYALEKKQVYDKYKSILNSLKNKLDNKKEMETLLDSLIQVSIFGDFGLTKKSLGKILNRKNTKMTEFLNILKKNNLCLEIRSGRHCFYKANLDELDKLKNITF